MTRYYLGTTRTGRNLIEIPVYDGSWSTDYLGDETVDVSIDLSDPDIRVLDLANTASGAYAFLAAVEGETIKAAGPIWTADYDRDNKSFAAHAKGMNTIFNHRLLLPLVAQTLDTNQWTIPDPKDKTKSIPNPAVRTYYSGYTLGTIAKKWIQQALGHTGGDLPIFFNGQFDIEGVHERMIEGTDFKMLGDALADIMGVENGPEIRFEKKWSEDGYGIEWHFRAGNPILASDGDPHHWDLTLEEPPGYGLKISTDASNITGRAWQTGGRQADTVLLARLDDPTTTDAGYPLLESMDSSHSSVIEADTLYNYAAADLARGKRPQELWSFEAYLNPQNDDGLPAGPQIEDIKPGDYGNIKLAPYDPETEIGDVFLPNGGTFRQRILSLSHSTNSDTVSVTLAPRIIT